MAEPLLIPADAAQRLLAAANGDAALLYLYLFENRPLSGAQTALRMTQARYDLACATLQQLGLWPQEARTHLDASQAPAYTEQAHEPRIRGHHRRDAAAAGTGPVQ